MQSAARLKINEIKAKCNQSPLLDGKGGLIKNLGFGSFGIVSHIISKENFAQKSINFKKNMKNLKSDEEILEHLSCAFSEYQIMKKNLPNVVRSYRCYFDETNMEFSFTMDLMRGGDLGTLII